jgi:hypothetical protein
MAAPQVKFEIGDEVEFLVGSNSLPHLNMGFLEGAPPFKPARGVVDDGMHGKWLGYDPMLGHFWVRFHTPVCELGQPTRLGWYFTYRDVGKTGFPTLVRAAAQAAVPKVTPAIRDCSEWRRILDVQIPREKCPSDGPTFMWLSSTRPEDVNAGRVPALVYSSTAQSVLDEHKRAALRDYQRRSLAWPYCDAHMAPMEFSWNDKSYIRSTGRVRCAHGAKSK